MDSHGELQGPLGFARMAVGFLLLAAAVGSAVYIAVHLIGGP